MVREREINHGFDDRETLREDVLVIRLTHDLFCRHSTSLRGGMNDRVAHFEVDKLIASGNELHLDKLSLYRKKGRTASFGLRGADGKKFPAQDKNKQQRAETVVSQMSRMLELVGWTSEEVQKGVILTSKNDVLFVVDSKFGLVFEISESKKDRTIHGKVRTSRIGSESHD